MTLHELYQMIDLQPCMIEKLDQMIPFMDMEALEPYLVRLMDSSTTADAYAELNQIFADEVKPNQSSAGDPEHIQMLACQMECARRMYDRYQEMGISDEIFKDTFGCFHRFNEECLVRYGKMYFDRGWWTYRQISMSEFRIGALEYEFIQHEGQDAIAVHIPSDADFSPASVSASLALAKEFLARYYPDYHYHCFTCDSWLLGSSLRSLLPEGSNIRAFQDRFEIIEEASAANDYLEWAFRVPSGTPAEELPEKTGLQKRIKAHVLSGGTMGVGVGILRDWK